MAERCRKRNCEAKFRSDKNSYILNAIRKHGPENFISEQIDTAENLEELKSKEIYYIKLYNSQDRNIGYNLTAGGEGNLGLKMSEATKEKIRQKHLGLKDSEETILKKSASAKLRDSSVARENCRLSNIKKSKTVEKYDLFENLLDTYTSISETKIKNSIDRSGLTAYLNSDKPGLNKPYKGFVYRFKINI